MTSMSRPFCTAETHLSWLVMVGDRVLKAKKPIWTEFVDLTTREARQDVAEREVRLNRRLAPDVYLGVARLDGVAGLDEPVVVMRRMPDDRRLALLASHDADLRDAIKQLAHVLADFHQVAASAPGSGTVLEAHRLWRDNAQELHEHGAAHVPGDQVARVLALAERYLSGRGELLEQRMRAGRCKDGHGDLQADDIFLLDDGPRVLDCLEFNDRLRYGDVLADMAFLAMDLERLGRPELGVLLLAEHRRLLDDDWPQSLADHWIAYRAQVRAKVACLRAAQGDESAAQQARDLLDLAERHLLRAQVQIVDIGGMPGTGKSTVADATAKHTGWALLRSDVIRQRLPPAPGSTVGMLDRGRYSPDASEQVLSTMLAEAAALLAAGRSVVLDATFSSHRWRQATEDLAAGTGSDVTFLRTVLPDATADRRLRARTAEGRDASEATADIAPALRERFEDWPEAVDLDSRRDAETLVDDVMLAVMSTGPAKTSNGDRTSAFAVAEKPD